MIHRVLILFFAILSTALAGDPLELAVIGITGDRIRTKDIAGLTVVVTNKDSDESVVFIGIAVEKKSSDGKFGSFRDDIECPCDSKCRKELIVLKKAEARRAEWDLLGGYHCEKAGPGVYRFVVIARYSEAISGYVYDGISKEFTVEK